MGSGIDAIKDINPEHAELIAKILHQLMIVLLERLGALGGKVTVPITEVDATGGKVCYMRIINGNFEFHLERKQ